MKKAIMNKWVKALRSGKYKQCKEDLCQVDDKGNLSYCCLGVLTQLYINERKRQKKGNNIKGFVHMGNYEEIYGYSPDIKNTVATPAWYINEETGLLPDVVAKWAGFDMHRQGWSTGSIHGFHEDKNLSTMNDGYAVAYLKPKSFKQIANIIKNNYTNI